MSINLISPFTKSPRRIHPFTKFALTAGVAGLLLVLPMGCGGGDSPSPITSPTASVSPTPTPEAVSTFMNFLWGKRTRNVGIDASNVASALSATVRFYPGGSASATPVEIKLNRDPSQLNSYSTTLNTGKDISVAGVYLVTVTLYPEANQSGIAVGSASFLTTVNTETGELNNSVSVGSTVRTVTITSAPTTLTVGQNVDVVATPTDADGNVVPVTIGSVAFNVTDGKDKLIVVNGTSTTPFQVQGVAVGTATLTATIDNVTSDPTTITVN